MKLQDTKTATQHGPASLKEHLNRGAFYLVLLIGTCLIPFALARRTTWRAPEDTTTVSNLNDRGPGSLRQALADANDGDTIDFAVSGTISLTSGELVIDKSVAITGGSPTLGSYGGGVLNDQATPTISNCSLTTNSSTYGGAISSDGSDGNATLAVLNTSITGNYAVFAGGGIYNAAYLAALQRCR